MFISEFCLLHSCSFFFLFFSPLLHWGIHPFITSMRYPLWDLCRYLERIIVTNKRIGRRVKLWIVRIYMNYRQHHVLFDLCESDLPWNIPWRSSSLFHVVLFLNEIVCMHFPFSWYSTLETGCTNLPYDSMLCCYAQEWTLIEYNILDARLK